MKTKETNSKNKKIKNYSKLTTSSWAGHRDEINKAHDAWFIECLCEYISLFGLTLKHIITWPLLFPLVWCWNILTLPHLLSFFNEVSVYIHELGILMIDWIFAYAYCIWLLYSADSYTDMDSGAIHRYIFCLKI